jgi:hypothetical protein
MAGGSFTVSGALMAVSGRIGIEGPIEIVLPTLVKRHWLPSVLGPRLEVRLALPARWRPFLAELELE